MVALPQLNLEILPLPLLAHVYTAQAESSPHAAAKNTGEAYALRKIFRPEDIHLLLLSLLLHFDLPQFRRVELSLQFDQCLRGRIAGKRGGSARKQARGSRFFLGVIGIGQLKDGIDHELVVMDGCERIGKQGVQAIEVRRTESKGSRVGLAPFLKYIFKINAYSPDFIQHILAVLVESAFGGPAGEEQIEGELTILPILAGKAKQLSHALPVLHDHRITDVPVRLLQHRGHHHQLQFVEQEYLRGCAKGFVDWQAAGEGGGEGDGSQDGLHFGERPPLVEGESAGVLGGTVVCQLSALFLSRLPVTHQQKLSLLSQQQILGPPA